jgi:ATP-dependent HslUV protease, peptidase subunit HslV
VLVLSGEGDVIEPDDGIAAIGSGAPYATAAAKALINYTDHDARMIVEAAMRIAADLCIFTNDHFTIETVQRNPAGEAVIGPRETIEGSHSSNASHLDDDDDEEGQ